ncbi:hypothetical protein P4H61_07325 [Paenibacillus peoriae]|uniref:hypothetical protein n=1 Tax=Paenibacillus peoriae TaxID=59893 RepID=UPI00026C6370|nr:hypothetical protein [Paenibacillus peoriae]MEC0181310.1 hypothetical protein [Paenibacillus peoriae]
MSQNPQETTRQTYIRHGQNDGAGTNRMAEISKAYGSSILFRRWGATIHGYPAIEFTIKGQKDVNHYVTHVAIIETEKSYHQIHGYTPASKYSRLKKELHDITYSFREIHH